MWNTNACYTRIKLCYFESFEATWEASSIGADALGFHILEEHTKDWREKAERFQSFFRVLPATIDRVLLIDYPFNVVEEVLSIASFDTVQLYPDWNPKRITELKKRAGRPVKILKVMSSKMEENDPADPAEFLKRYEGVADGILLDSFRVGGTGQLGDIETAQRVVELSLLPVFLAGGLDSKNVSERIRLVRPFGVDVESGVSEMTPLGLMKNLGKCKAFLDAVARTDRELLRHEAHSNSPSRPLPTV